MITGFAIRNKIKRVCVHIYLDVMILLRFFSKKNGMIDLQSTMKYYPKQFEDDCGIQSIRSLISFFHQDIPTSEDLYHECKELGILDDTGLIYKKLVLSKLLQEYTISIFSYFPVDILVTYLTKKQIPIIVSIKHTHGIGHLVVITKLHVQANRIVTLRYFDSETNAHQTISGSEFNKIYNKRAFFLEEKYSHPSNYQESQ